MRTNKYRQSFYLFIFTVILLGILFRFMNLDKKLYWHDEVFTSLHITGYTDQEWKSNLFTGEILERDDLQKYLKIDPNKTFADTIKVLAINDPHHPPLYYLLARYWRQLFGDSITVIRSFSAVVSLLIFPAIYWLCWELFGIPLVGSMGMALVAISPFYVLYAQEAREYALLTALMILANASLLRAIKLTLSQLQKSYGFWLLYSSLITLSLYTSLLTLYIIISQIIYVFVLEKFRLTKTLILQGVALLVSAILFIPWIWVFIANYEQYKILTDWTKITKIPRLELIKTWGLNLSRIFFDVGWEFENLFLYAAIALSVILVCYALYFLYRNTPIKCWGLIFSLIVVQGILLFIPDLVGGGVRSLSPRYLIPIFLATDVAIAYLVGTKLLYSHTQRVWSVLTAMIIAFGIISCTINAQADTSWTKVISYSLPQVARLINQTSDPLLVGNNQSYHPGNIFALSYLLKPEVKYQLLSEELGYQLPNEFNHIFFLSPSDELRLRLETQQGVKVEKVFEDVHLRLWKVRRS